MTDDPATETPTPTLHLRAPLEPRGPAGAIVLSDPQVAELGGGAKAFGVRVSVNGRTAQLRLARMRGESLIGFSREVRERLGVALEEVLDVTIERDDSERDVELPEELVTALAGDSALKTRFAALAPSRRKEHARAVAEAKRPETRARRLEQVLDALRGG